MNRPLYEDETTMNEALKKEEIKEKILKEEKAECPECGRENELEAKFCEECGYDLLGGRRCPKCGATISENADICEACGEWLLEGQCKFCYAPFEEGAKFCAECGNPVNGIECPQCHNLSYFDFCKYCDTPLTKQAVQTIEDLKNLEEIYLLKQALEPEQEPTITSPERIELEKMKEYQQKFEQPEVRRKAFTLFSKEEIATLDTRIQQIQEEKKVQEEKEKRTRSEVLEKMQQKNFTNNQEARRFFGALKVLLPMTVKKNVRKKVSKPTGWLCNAYNCLHPEGPQGCSNPAPGGKWIFKEIIEETVEMVTEIGEVEI
ncbi:MAG: zinc ribbon domain-containing protein [bacterium]